MYGAPTALTRSEDPAPRSRIMGGRIIGSLIINADDYGWNRATDEAVDRLAHLGTLSSTTVMTNMPSAEDVLGLAHAHPRLGIGVHLTLTQGAPLSPRSEVRSLIGDAGDFHPLAELSRRLRRRSLDPAEVAAELTRQIRRAKQLLGTRLDHWDSHHAVHRFAPLYGLFLRVCAAEGLGAMRAHKHYWPGPPLRARSPSDGVRSAAVESYYRLQLVRARRRFVTPRGLMVLRDLTDLADLPLHGYDGTFEVLTHPATSTDGFCGTAMLDDRVRQYEALSSVEVVTALRDVTLLRFGDLEMRR